MAVTLRSWRGAAWLGAVTALAVAISTGPAAAASPATTRSGTAPAATWSSSLLRYPYLTDLTTTSVQVSWANNTQTKGVVKWGTPGNCTSHTTTSTSLGSPITVAGAREYQNSTAISGLAPGTTYCYRVYPSATGTDLLGSDPSPTFRTMPSASTAFSFAVLGDWGDTTNSTGTNDGSTNTNQQAVDQGIANSAALFALSSGDIAYPSGSRTTYGDLVHTGKDVSAVFGPQYWKVPGASVPLFPVTGNHGFNSTFFQELKEPKTVSGSSGVYGMQSYPALDGANAATYPSSWYAFSVGTTRFYLLEASWADTNVGTASPYQLDHDQHWATTSSEYTWLKNDLAAHPGGLKFAVFHYPLRSDSSAASESSDTFLQNRTGNSNSLEQLLHDAGVSLVFNGHAHIYQRNLAPPGGVVSYVSGGGGARLEPVKPTTRCSSTDAYSLGWSYSSTTHGSACGAAAKPTAISQVFHFLKVTVNGTTVTVTPTNAAGNPFDAQTYNFAADSTAPTAPNPLTATATSSGAVLNWGAATDGVGVTDYDVYRDGSYLDTVDPRLTSYTDATITAGSSHTYTVRARDQQGNQSPDSNSAGVNQPDNSPPTQPTNVTAMAAGSNEVDLSWTAATDNVGVDHYQVLRGGAQVGTVSGTSTSYADTTVAASTTYSYTVVAVDAAGNASQPSAAASVTTPAGGGTPVFSDGFESGDFSSWTTNTGPPGLVVQSAVTDAGSGYAAEESSTSATTYAYKTLPSTYANLYYRARVNLISRGSTSSVQFLKVRTGAGTAGTSMLGLYVNSSGALSVRNDIGGVTSVSAQQLATGSGWHTVELHAVVAGTNSTVEAWLDGSRVLSLAGQNLGTTPIGRLQLGDSTGGRTYDVVIDNVVADTQFVP